MPASEIVDAMRVSSRNGYRKKHFWTDEERMILRWGYRHNRKSREELASRFGVTPAAVQGQVARMGITHKISWRRWTEGEKQQLEQLIGEVSLKTIAGRMHRSISSIVTMAKRLRLSRRAHTEWYTKQEVCEIFGVNQRRVQVFIDRGVLEARPFYPDRQPQKNSKGPWRISRKSVADFLRRYPEELNGYNVDLMQVVEILVGLA